MFALQSQENSGWLRRIRRLRGLRQGVHIVEFPRMQSLPIRVCSLQWSCQSRIAPDTEVVSVCGRLDAWVRPETSTPIRLHPATDAHESSEQKRAPGKVPVKRLHFCRRDTRRGHRHSRRQWPENRLERTRDIDASLRENWPRTGKMVCRPSAEVRPWGTQCNAGISVTPGEMS